jgi:hypothetical protein
MMEMIRTVIEVVNDDKLLASERSASMKLFSFWILILLHGIACPWALAAEKPAANLQLAEAPVVQEGWSWTYQATEKLYAGNTESSRLNGKFEINYYKGRVRFLRQDGKAMLGVANPRELELMVPVGQILQAQTQFFQFPLQVGKTWDSNFVPRGRQTSENKVVGVETVTTRAGSFSAFRIERRILFKRVIPGDLPQDVYLTYDYLYSPKTRSVVKYHFQREMHESSQGNLALEQTVDIELIGRGNTPTAPQALAANAKIPQTGHSDEIETKYLAPQTDSYGRPDVGRQKLNLPSGPLTLRMNVVGQRKEADGTYSELLVKEGSALRSRDNFQVHFETTSPAFIYILLYDSQGKASQLFPDPKIDQPNFVEGGRSIVIPERNSWFWLDENPGSETVYVIAAKNSMADIKGLLAKMENADDAGKKTASQQIRSSIAIMQRGVGGVTKGQTVTYTLSDGKKIQNVTDVVTGTGSVVRAVSFQHR